MRLRTFFIVLFIFICFFILCLYLSTIFNEFAIYFLYFALLCPLFPFLIDEIITDMKDKKERTE